MIYKTITLKERNEDWHCRVLLLPGDRVEVPTYPNSPGIFHYPITMPDEDAFKILQDYLIKVHALEIDRLSESLKKLNNLTYRNSA